MAETINAATQTLLRCGSSFVLTSMALTLMLSFSRLSKWGLAENSDKVMRKQTPSVCAESVGTILIEVADPGGTYNEIYGFQIFSLSDAPQQVEPIDFRHH